VNVALVNKSKWSDESLKAIVDFLAPCFGHIDMPVRLTIKSRPNRWGTWGKAYFPSPGRRCIKAGEWACIVYIGECPRQYPITRTYKKRAGGYVANSIVDEVVHTIAHELRHIEQFEACRLFRLEHKEHRDSGLPFSHAFRNWERGGRAHFPGNSCEVDAELVSHGLLAAYQTHIENNLKARAA